MMAGLPASYFLRQGDFRNRSDGGPEKVRRADASAARRRWSDRADRGCRRADRENRQEREIR